MYAVELVYVVFIGHLRYIIHDELRAIFLSFYEMGIIVNRMCLLFYSIYAESSVTDSSSDFLPLCDPSGGIG